MPPLRERKEDIPLLVEHFLVKYRYEPGAIPTTITEDALKRLVDYDWPGNVRELENAIERAVVLSRGNPITLEHLPAPTARVPADAEGPRAPPDAARRGRGRSSTAGAGLSRTTRPDTAAAAGNGAPTTGGTEGPGRRPREAADQGGARAGRRQSHQGGRGARDLSTPAVRQDQGIRPRSDQRARGDPQGPDGRTDRPSAPRPRPSRRDRPRVRRPANGRSSAVVAHLADTEERTIGRTRRMLSEDEPALAPYDPDELAIKRGISRWRWPTSWIGSRRCA